jgi:hypothetical protein
MEDVEASVDITAEAAEVTVAATARANTNQEITPTKNIFILLLLYTYLQ